MKKLWISESSFVDVEDQAAAHEALVSEIAVRQRAVDWMGLYGYLPDPDPVLRKLNQDITVYRQMLSDAHVWSCYQSRKSGTLSCEWEVREPAEGSVRANRRAFQLIEEIMDSLDVHQVINDILEAPFFGMAPLEVIWQAAEAKWLPVRVEGKPPEWFVFDLENNLRFLSAENQIEGEELPDRKFLLPRHHASYQNPYGERILARCFWPVAFKKGGFKFWAIFTEKYGMPWVVGKVPRRTTEPDRTALLSRLASMVQDAVAVINDDETVEIMEAKGKQGTADVYERLISTSNREISKAVLGQTLSTELDKGGSYAATEGHLEVRQDIVDMDKRMVCAAFNNFFNWVTELNFADADPPEFSFYQEEDIQKDRAERDEILVKQGVRFSEDYYRRIYNLEEGDFTLGAPQQSGNPATPESAQEGAPFAENSAQTRFSQDDVGKVSQQGSKTATEAIETLLDPVMKEIQGAKSYEQIGERLYAHYPHLDGARFQELLARAMFTSALGGAVSEQQEGKE